MTAELEIQKWKRQGRSDDELDSEFAINTKRHPAYPNLQMMKYDQLASSFDKRIVQECRGLILDESNDFKVVNLSLFKFFNMHEPLAATVDWSTASVQEKCDGCFRHGQGIRTWSGKSVKISKILPGDIVMGADAAGTPVPSEVLAVKKTPGKSNWIKITFDRFVAGRSKHLIVTDNHHVFSNGTYVPAVSLSPGDSMYDFMEVPSDESIHFVRSSLLGDGSISRAYGGTARFCTSHKSSHDEYNDLSKKWLGDFSVNSRNVTSGYGTRMTQVSSKTCHFLSRIREEWYPLEKKSVPQDLSWMNDFSVAVWYMDDGSILHNSNQKDRATLSTHGFSEIDVRRLASKLHAMYGVECSVQNSKGWYIRINAGRNGEIDKFWKSISGHIVPCMRYKLPIEYRCCHYEDRLAGASHMELRGAKIVSISAVDHLDRMVFPSGSVGYDIQTSTGNYFSGGMLVHNSLIQLYRYDGQWHAASSGTPDGGGDVNGFGITFSDYFWQTFKKYDQQLPDVEGHCFWFELSGPINRIVVQHSETSLTLLGGRDLETLQELTLDKAAAYWPKIPRVRTFPMTNIDQVVAAFAEMDPLKQEGFVICDGNFNRIKCKCPAYVTLHALKGGMSRRAIVQIVRSGEISEIESAFPEFAEMLEECRGRYSKLLSECESDMNDLSGIAVQKEFALQAVHRKCPGALFAVRAGKAKDFRHYFAEGLHLDSLVSTLGYKAGETMPGHNPQNPPSSL